MSPDVNGTKARFEKGAGNYKSERRRRGGLCTYARTGARGKSPTSESFRTSSLLVGKLADLLMSKTARSKTRGFAVNSVEISPPVTLRSAVSACLIRKQIKTPSNIAGLA